MALENNSRGHFNIAIAMISRDKGWTLALPVWHACLAVTILSLIIFCTIFGNILVILSVFTYKPLRSVQNFLIVSLAVADLSVSILVMPGNVIAYVVGQWHFGSVLCDIWLTSDIFFCTASILNLCAIALDRYWAIRCPMSYANQRTLKMVLFMIFLVYVLSGLISIPPLFGWKKTSNDTTVCTLTDEKGYVIFSASGSFFIPAIVMCVVYFNIFLAVQKRLKQRRDRSALNKVPCGGATTSPLIQPKTGAGNNSDKAVSLANGERTKSQKKNNRNSGTATKKGGGTNDSSSEPEIANNHNSDNDETGTTQGATQTCSAHAARPNQTNTGGGMGHFVHERQKISLSRERRATRTLGIIMGVFVLSWVPFFLMYVIMPFCGQTCLDHWDSRIENFIVWLGYINSALNPVIYTVFNMDFRRAFQKLLKLG